MEKNMITKVPNVVFHTRVRDDNATGPNPYRWSQISTFELFGEKKILAFSLPGAFTPTCSTYQVPRFEEMYNKFRALGIDDVYCISVNDAFVMNAWAKKQGIENIKMIPDGSGKFTRLMGMLVDKDNLGFGMRSWRYAFLSVNGDITRSWIEPGLKDLAQDDPYGETNPEKIYADIRQIYFQ
jgi:peroxiredoxin